MNVILTHIGDNFPKYIKYTFKQFRCFNSGSKVYFLTSRSNIKKYKELFREFDVMAIPIEEYTDKRIKKIKTYSKIDFLKREIKKYILNMDNVDFWINTLTRFFYIENFIKERNIERFIYFENDVLVYCDLNKLKKGFNAYRSLAITACSDYQVMTGFAYFRSQKILSDFNKFVIKEYNKKSIDLLKKQYNSNIINEMLLLRKFINIDNSINMELPIIPYGDHSNNFDLFNSIFDPASYGQFLDGIPSDAGVSFISQDHYIGKEFRKNNNYKIVWIKNNNLSVPYLNVNDNLVRINNLHIHSKRLGNFISYD